MTFAKLLSVIGRSPQELVTVCSKSDGAMSVDWTTVAQAPTKAAGWSGRADVWFGVQPLREGVTRGRGKADDVASLVTLYVDLDYVRQGKADGLTVEQSLAIIGRLSEIMGTGPSAIVRSGHGLQPYWPIEPVTRDLSEAALSSGLASVDEATRLLSSWRTLVMAVAAEAGGVVDTGVYDLPRIMRVPGPPNMKGGAPGVETGVAFPAGGRRLSRDEARARILDARGLVESHQAAQRALGARVARDGGTLLDDGGAGYASYDGDRVFAPEEALHFLAPHLDAVRCTPEGSGFNAALNVAAQACARFVLGGVLSEADAVALLEGAVTSAFPAGPNHQDRSTIRSGLSWRPRVGGSENWVARSPSARERRNPFAHGGRYVTPVPMSEVGRARTLAERVAGIETLVMDGEAGLVEAGVVEAVSLEVGRSSEAGVVEAGGADAKRFYRLHELVGLPEGQPLIKGIIDVNSTGMLTGMFGTYKSFLLIAWGLSLASGRAWEGHEVPERRRVLYVAAEGTAGIAKRSHAWCRAHDVDPLDPEVGDWFHVFPRPVKIVDDEALAEIWNHIAENDIGLCIWDTLHKMAPGVDENSSTEMGLVMGRVEEVRVATGCAMIYAHHTGHLGQRARGSSSLTDDVDFSWHISRDEGIDVGSQRSLSCSKVKDGDVPGERLILFTKVAGPNVLDPDAGSTGWVSLAPGEFRREQGQKALGGAPTATAGARHLAILKLLDKADDKALRRSDLQALVPGSNRNNILSDVTFLEAEGRVTQLKVGGNVWHVRLVTQGLSEEAAKHIEQARMWRPAPPG